MKKEINRKLEFGILESLLEEMNEYERRCPADLEIFCQKAIYYFMLGETEQALYHLQKALEINPYYIDALYNMGIIYEQMGEFGKAYECFFKGLKLDGDQTECRIELNKAEQSIKQSEKAPEEKLQEMEYIAAQKKTGFGTQLILNWITSKEKGVGTRLITNSDYYIAEYTRLGFGVEEVGAFYRRVELRKIVSEGNSLQTNYKEPYYLPIALEKMGLMGMKSSEKSFSMLQPKETFFGYRMKEPMHLVVMSENKILMAEPILLKKDPAKKSLVLSIFVDGLSQSFLEEYGLENCMPKTYRYFSDGIYCTNFYSTGEWTYPSMAAYFSGQYTVDHKMFYPDYDYCLSKDIKVLGECLKEAGYHTAKIDGDWRTNPDYGHVRGMDRVLSATYGEAMHIKEVIYEAMDHLETMKETNQYLYLNIGELHDIVDNYKLPMDVQMQIDLEDLQDERFSGTTSVKQQFNQAKKNRYRQQMKYVDRYLGIFFDYLRENFAEEEILVTLFSDHGQGFLVPNGEFFLSDERSKVPLLIKGASKEWTICNELMSIVDYLPILGKLAGFEVDLTGRRSRLPRFFGGEHTHKYIVSESLYPGDTYKIALRNEELIFFFESKQVVQKDARVDLSEYEYSIKTPEGEEVKDACKIQECLDYVLEHIKHFRIYK